MAYYLYKYLKRKREEKKSGIVDDSHLNPELAQRHGQARLVSLDREEITTGAPKHTVAAPLTTEENARIKEEGAKRRRYRWRMILGLLLPNFLAAVDLTIVAPAVPVISTHFSMFTFKLLSCLIFNSVRSTWWKFQLDRLRVYTNLYDLCPHFRTDCRHLRPSFRLAVQHVLHTTW
jgi:hypothetical protein